MNDHAMCTVGLSGFRDNYTLKPNQNGIAQQVSLLTQLWKMFHILGEFWDNQQFIDNENNKDTEIQKQWKLCLSCCFAGL